MVELCDSLQRYRLERVTWAHTVTPQTFFLLRGHFGHKANTQTLACKHTQTCGVRELVHDMSAVYGASLQFALRHTATVWRKGALANTILWGNSARHSVTT